MGGAPSYAPPLTLDVNRYANNARTQFMNTAPGNNGAWDFAQDARVDTNGLALARVNPAWTLCIQNPGFNRDGGRSRCCRYGCTRGSNNANRKPTMP
jgi:hypothetical protein